MNSDAKKLMIFETPSTSKKVLINTLMEEDKPSSWGETTWISRSVKNTSTFLKLRITTEGTKSIIILLNSPLQVNSSRLNPWCSKSSSITLVEKMNFWNYTQYRISISQKRTLKKIDFSIFFQKKNLARNIDTLTKSYYFQSYIDIYGAANKADLRNSSVKPPNRTFCQQIKSNRLIFRVFFFSAMAN